MDAVDRRRPGRPPHLASTAALLLALLAPSRVLAQRTAENVVTAAQDAFGSSIGNEQIGLYGASEVRGFSPIDAGNVRIEGLSFDQQGTLNARLVQGSTVHVGLTAQGYPFPAPTGIVDYRLRKPGADALVSLVAGFADYGAPFVELDAQLPILADRLGVAAGISYSHDEYYDGSDARVASVAVIPRWRPFEQVEVLPFWSFSASRDEEVAPLILVAGPDLPPRFPRRRYYGQPWADLDADVTNLGLIARARLGEGWDAALGAFHSRREILSDHAELFSPTEPNGLTRELVIADPPQRRGSTGGELSVGRSAVEGPRLHRLRARLRARAQDSRYGGSSEPLDLGERRLGSPSVVDEPPFEFGVRTRDSVRQWTAGLAYEGRWQDVGELVLGLQKTDYQKTVTLPDAPASRTASSPWLVNAAIAWHATPRLAAYAGYTRGLEESGIAPGNAANRNQALPAIVTQQLDAGLRYALTDRLRAVAGVFDVRKPNFTTDALGVFTRLGAVRHQGIELSFTGELFDGFTLVSGAILMRPRVSGPAVQTGQIGPKPIGQVARTLRLDANYRLPWLEALSLDLGLRDTARRTASSDNQLDAPALTSLDLGARYRFTLLGKPGTLRLLTKNVTNAYGWRVLGDGAFRTNNPRAISAQVAIDL